MIDHLGAVTMKRFDTNSSPEALAIAAKWRKIAKGIYRGADTMLGRSKAYKENRRAAREAPDARAAI